MHMYTNNRQLYESLYGHLYTFYDNQFYEQFGDGRCVYCGEDAETIDHIYPISQLAKLANALGNISDLSPDTLDLLRLVPACISCNSWLSARLFIGVRERRSHIASKLLHRMHKISGGNISDWNDSDLEEIGYSLRSAILSGQSNLDSLKRRYKWACGAWLDPIDSDITTSVRRYIGAFNKTYVKTDSDNNSHTACDESLECQIDQPTKQHETIKSFKQKRHRKYRCDKTPDLFSILG